MTDNKVHYIKCSYLVFDNFYNNPDDTENILTQNLRVVIIQEKEQYHLLMKILEMYSKIYFCWK